MKKLFALIAVFGMLMMGASVFAQEDPATQLLLSAEDTTEMAEELTPEMKLTRAAAPEEEKQSGLGVLHTNLKTKFIEGGAGFMGAVLMTY